LQAYKREVRDSERWLKEHRQDCVTCSRSAGRKPLNQPCATGVRIQKCIEMNQEIVSQMTAAPAYEQPALFDVAGLDGDDQRQGGAA
jgi:hypothetical protein